MLSSECPFPRQISTLARRDRVALERAIYGGGNTFDNPGTKSTQPKGWLNLGRRLRNLLSDVVKPETLPGIYNAYDVVGDIAIIRNDGLARNESEKIAETIMSIHGNVKTVLAQTGAVEGPCDFAN